MLSFALPTCSFRFDLRAHEWNTIKVDRDIWVASVYISKRFHRYYLFYYQPGREDDRKVNCLTLSMRWLYYSVIIVGAAVKFLINWIAVFFKDFIQIAFFPTCLMHEVWREEHEGVTGWYGRGWNVLQMRGCIPLFQVHIVHGLGFWFLRPASSNSTRLTGAHCVKGLWWMSEHCRTRLIRNDFLFYFYFFCTSLKSHIAAPEMKWWVIFAIVIRRLCTVREG